MRRRRAQAMCFAVLLAVCAVCSAARSEAPADSEKPYFRGAFIYEQKNVGFVQCHGSTLAELPNGDVIAAWYGGDFEKAKNVAIYASYIKKGETSWSAPKVIHDAPALSDGNPVLWDDGKGTLWLFFVTIMKENWNDARLFYKTSADGGLTWGEPATLIERLGWMPRNKPTLLKNGDILLPIYDETYFRSYFMISSDAGKTWNRTGPISAPGGNIQPTAVQLSDGSLLAGMRTGSKNGLLWWTRSENNGRKWSKPYTNEIKNPGAAADMVKLANGHLALLFNDSATDRNPLTVAVSTDEGLTWKYKRDLEANGPGSYHYPAVIQTSDGRIHVTYTYDRLTIKHVAFDEDWVIQGSR